MTLIRKTKKSRLSSGSIQKNLSKKISLSLKKDCISILILFLLLFGGITFAEELPFEVGDTICFEFVRSDRMVFQQAKVIEIKGRWIHVDARPGNNSNWYGWVNLDNVSSLSLVKKGK